MIDEGIYENILIFIFGEIHTTYSINLKFHIEIDISYGIIKFNTDLSSDIKCNSRLNPIRKTSQRGLVRSRTLIYRLIKVREIEMLHSLQRTLN